MCTTPTVARVMHALRAALTSKLKDICDDAMHQAEAAQAADLTCNVPTSTQARSWTPTT